MLILIHHLKKLFPLKRPVFQYVSIDIHMVSFGYSLSIQHDWLVVWNMIWIIFHFIYGMPSFPLTLTPSFFKMVIAPPTRWYNPMNINPRELNTRWVSKFRVAATLQSEHVHQAPFVLPLNSCFFWWFMYFYILVLQRCHITYLYYILHVYVILHI